MRTNHGGLARGRMNRLRRAPSDQPGKVLASAGCKRNEDSAHADLELSSEPLDGRPKVEIATSE